MANPLEYPFGTIDTRTAGRWLHLSPEEDREVWMLNLMKYKAVADYGDGTTAAGPAVVQKTYGSAGTFTVHVQYQVTNPPVNGPMPTSENTSRAPLAV